MDRGAWWATVHGVTKESDMTEQLTLSLSLTQHLPLYLHSVTWDICLSCVLSHFSCVCLFATPGTVTCQAPLSMGFSRQEYWSGLPCPPPGGLPYPGIKPTSLSFLHWQGGSLPLDPPGKPWWLLKIRQKKKKKIWSLKALFIWLLLISPAFFLLVHSYKRSLLQLDFLLFHN